MQTKTVTPVHTEAITITAPVTNNLQLINSMTLQYQTVFYMTEQINQKVHTDKLPGHTGLQGR